MASVLSVRNLSKNYGDIEAVRNISFEVEEGEIFGLIGPNGAGKTTTLRMVTTLLKPSSGVAEVAGFDIAKNPEKVRESISYLPEEAGAYKNLTGLAYLKFMAEIFFSNTDQREEAVQNAVQMTGLAERINSKIGSYSKGMTRKLLLARAVMSSPKLAVLDEPTSGLDVVNALEVRNRIRSFAEKGMSILLSSHNMLEVEFLSDRVAVIDKGSIHITGTAKDLKSQYGAANLEEVFAAVVR